MVDELRVASCQCGGRCEAYVPPPAAGRQEVRQDFAASFAWPLRGSSKYFLMCMGVLEVLANLAPLNAISLQLPRILFALAVLVFASVFLLSVIRQSAIDPRAELEFPSVENVVDAVLVPVFRFSAAVCMYLGPGILLLRVSWWAGVLTCTAGCFLLPMALLALAIREEATALSPVFVVRSVRRVPFAPYCALAGGFLGLLAIRIPLEAVLTAVPPLRVLLGFSLSLYLACVQLRLLGVFYRRHEARLQWF